MKSVEFWKGKRVLLTGHTGFKGGWLALWLKKLGANLTGVALPPNTNPNLFELAQVGEGLHNYFCDIRDASALAAVVRKAKPEIVFHLAAQPLVRASYLVPLDTFAVNFMGTAHLLDALRGIDTVKAVIMVTTDKVYQNLERPYPYREEDILGGHDPYSASKAASELLIDCYYKSFLADAGVAVASARAGNVIGGGDWSQDRLIPDMVRAWQSGVALEIRQPDAIRPWQHVLEPLAGYLTLAQKLWEQPELSGAYNFGPLTNELVTVRQLVELSRIAYGAGEVVYGNPAEGPHEASMLSLEIAKARFVLDVCPKWGLADAVGRTMNWYQQQHQGSDTKSLCESEISAYMALL